MPTRQVEELFEMYANKSVHFLSSYKGNRGDGLIYMGCKTLFNKYNIKCNEFNESQKAKGKTLFIRGSGAFCLPHNGGVAIVSGYIDKFEEIFILPTTFDVRYKEIKDFIVNLPEKVTIICRERYSYQSVLKIAPYKKKVFLDHDMALRIDYSKWRKEGEGILNAFRTDGERGIKQEHENSMDISRGTVMEWEGLIKTVSQYSEIHSDRLHVCIPSAMLGKKTYVYPNRYFKVRGVYEYSLADFDHVQWVETEVRKNPSPLVVNLLETSKKFLGRRIYRKLRSCLSG